MALSLELIRKYNQPVPRYTSYPTVPLWDNKIDQSSWEKTVKIAFDRFGKKEGISLYIHLPFCENLCTYCGCTKRITKNHKVEDPYIEAVLREWEHYLGILDYVPKISGIHLGGGTPTFFAPESLEFMISKILKSAERTKNFEFSFEGHPNNTTFEHLQELAILGFDRLSYGIQDFDEKVQQAIHRIQPFEKVKLATDNARKLGYTSVNFDLIYGLPHQTLLTLENTFQKVAELRPERIAFYSYAHLPSAFPAQKSFEEFLPKEEEKRALYEFGKAKLIEMGYEEIGMDHFALPNDPLCEAKKTGTLHRNFMGYTTLPSRMLLGLGASSISDVWIGFAQNEKRIEAYEDILKEHHMALVKGHLLTDEDLLVRELILDLICKGKATIPFSIWENIPAKNKQALKEFEEEGLLTLVDLELTIHPDGMAVVRNICSNFDLRMIQTQEKKAVFSKAI
ncbi:oxygen-independent coproporphyrinogen III oxidase [Algoriphagus sp. AK58]|uniref:oxygen-independent coproporphyrinogen III oxidase n=1 Tax=Algoriphagus sp. AK58 TaxID=1406877 RepID=UPI00164EEF09|nr:oxygen-independent coproporphyrinogen III oxidase [Algoriphagus sp. AK58]MBC6368963.1 oxygen-independent coproporphyrinogen III oxidase [Algoriphagus sp. AK58]